MKYRLIVPMFLAALGAAAPAIAAVDVNALEARIKLLEDNAERMRVQADEALAALQQARAEIEQLKQASTAATAPMPPPAPAPAAGANGNEFNPAISIILNGAWAHHSVDPEDYQRAGFPLAGEAGPGAQGLSLGESEIVLSANVDDKFYGQLSLALESEDGEDEIGIEEAYIDTTALRNGFTLRAGRFFSNIGYLNNHHAHTDDFADRPLAYQAFLGGQYGDDGIQLRWVAPTDTFIEVGGELLRGEGYPSGGASNDGAGVVTAFAHVGGDIGLETSWLAGISMLRSETSGGEDGFSGDIDLYLADFTWKWAPNGNAKDGGVQLRAEYFLDDRDGEFVDGGDPASSQAWNGIRRGAYVEGVYRINRSWETGYRYDHLWADADGPYASDFDPYRHNAMLTWHNSEFSLLRLQWSNDHPNRGDTDNVYSLQYQVALGAHGAHKF